MVGILDDIGSAWGNYWEPKTVPAGAGYDPEMLGNARAQAIGSLGGNLLALSQGGLSPEARAGLLTKVGSAPLTYQQALLAGIEGKLHAATAAKTEQEVAAQKASDAQFADLIQQAKLRGTPGAVAGGGAPGAPVGGVPGQPAQAPGEGGIAGYSRTALAALKGPESGGDPGNVNKFGYSGLYQIGTGLANSAGLYQPAQDEAVSDAKGRAVNAWRGQWTIPGFEPMTHQQFLKNPQAQQAAGEAAMAHNWKDIVANGLDKYVGQTIGNVTITPEGLLQGAWLGGVGGLKSWLSGTGDPTDANKTPVSRWAALKPPPGFSATATDAGVAQPVPAGAPGAQGGGAGGGAPGAAGGAGGSVVGGVPVGGNAPPRFSIGNLSVEQLTTLSRMPRAEAQKWILEQSTKDEPFILTAEQVAAIPNLPPGTYKYSRSAGLTKVSDAPSRYMTPEEVAGRKNLNPMKEYQIDGMGNVKEVGERPAEPLTDQQKTDLKIPVTATAVRKADGTISMVTQGITRWATPKEKEDAGYPPDAKLLIKPDGTVDERDKGRDPYAPLNDADAQGVLVRYADQVKNGKLDANSPEGRRYRAAYDLAAKGAFHNVEQPDGTTQSVWRTQPVNFPRLGEAGTTPEPTTVKNIAPPTEHQAKARFYLNSMKSAEEDLDRLAASGHLPTTWRNTVSNNSPTAFGRWLLTDEGRQYKQAQEVWAEAYIRTVSGAVFGPGEEEKAANAFFPRPGDDKVTIAQKARTRARIQEGMGMMAGTQAAAAPDANKPPPKAIVTEIQRRLAAHEITWEQAVHLADKQHKGLSEFLTRPGQQ